MKLLDARHLNLITGIWVIQTRYQTCSIKYQIAAWKGTQQ